MSQRVVRAGSHDVLEVHVLYTSNKCLGCDSVMREFPFPTEILVSTSSMSAPPASDYVTVTLNEMSEKFLVFLNFIR